MPSAQSVPVASAISESRSSAPAARSGLPLRAAASISSDSSHIGDAELVARPPLPLGGGQRVLVAAEAVVAGPRWPSR